MTAEASERATFVADARTLFLLGNGPSLKSVDLKDLNGRATIGMNAAYRYWRQIGWRPTYYACLDTVVGLSHKDAIAGLIAETGGAAIRRFLLRDNLVEALGAVARTERVVNFDALRLFAPLLRPEPVTTGSHAALWAAAMGFRQVVLLGIDGNYVERVAGAEKRDGIELQIVADGENPNYFFDGYQQKGDRYNLPNPRPGLHLEAWETAALLLHQQGVAVVNGNPRSEVRYFPFIQPTELLGKGASAADASQTVAPSGSLASRADASEAKSLRMFWRRQRGLVLAGIAAALLAGAIVLFGEPSARFAGFASVALFSGLFLLLVYVRHAVSAHIERLDRRVTMLEVVQRDQQRMQAGNRPDGGRD